MNYRRLVNYLKENYYKKILINGRLPRRRTRHYTKCVNIWKTVGDTSIVTVNHRLNGISVPVLTATHNSYGSLSVSEFLYGSPLEARPHPQKKKEKNDIQAKWLNDVDSRKDVPLTVTRSQAVARIADRTASQHHWGSRDVIGHVTI